MSDLITIGIDPGPRPGICVLGDGPGSVVQCGDSDSAIVIVRTLIVGYSPVPVRLAIEQFVIGPKARVSRGAGQTTRELIGRMLALADQDGVAAVTRTAAQVMPWASDRRLQAAGLWDRSAGLKDARAACRHALFSTVWDSGAIDPMMLRR